MNENPLRTLYLYSDASFNQTSGIGIAGFTIYQNSPDHLVGLNGETHLIKILEKNNIRMELRAAIAALSHIQANIPMKDLPLPLIYLYSDCQAVTLLPSRRARLESKKFISSKSTRILNNADLYQDFFEIYDAILPSLIWVKGHSNNLTKNHIHEKFSTLDKLVRKKLRELN